MTLSVKYFEEMKKQVNILERDEKKRVNFSVHCECLVWIYDTFVSLETLKNYFCVCMPLCISLSFALHFNSENNFSVFSLSFTTVCTQTSRNKHTQECTHTSQV